MSIHPAISKALTEANFLCATLDEFGVGEGGVTPELLDAVWDAVSRALEYAQGIETRSAIDPKGRGPKGESPVTK